MVGMEKTINYIFSVAMSVDEVHWLAEVKCNIEGTFKNV